MAKITIGGAEHNGDLNLFIKTQAAWPSINGVREAYARVGAPTEDFPDGVPDPDVAGALEHMRDLAAIATFQMNGRVMSQAEFDAALTAHMNMVRCTMDRREVAQVRTFFVEVLAESGLDEGNDGQGAPLDEQVQEPGTEGPKGSTETSVG